MLEADQAGAEAVPGSTSYLATYQRLANVVAATPKTSALAALSLLVLLIPKLYQQRGAASFSALGRLLGL